MRTLLAASLLALSSLVAAQAWAQSTPIPPQDGTQDGAAADAPAIGLEEATTIQADDAVYGQADAPHELVVYASTTCGHCGAWFTEEWPLLRERADAGELRVALRPFPTAPEAVSVAGFLIAACGDDYFAAAQAQFEGQDATREALGEGRGQQRFLELARVAGIGSEAELQACFADEAAFATIDRGLQRGFAAGISGVPAFFLDGERVAGDPDAEAIAALLN